MRLAECSLDKAKAKIFLLNLVYSCFTILGMANVHRLAGTSAVLVKLLQDKMTLIYINKFQLCQSTRAWFVHVRNDNCLPAESALLINKFKLRISVIVFINMEERFW